MTTLAGISNQTSNLAFTERDKASHMAFGSLSACNQVYGWDPQSKRVQQGAVTVAFNLWADISLPSAHTDSDSISSTSPTLSLPSVTAAPYFLKIPTSTFAMATAPMGSMLDEFQVKMVQKGAQLFDKLYLEAAVAQDTAAMIKYIGQTAKENITATNELDAASIMWATAELAKQETPRLAIPGFGECYVGFVHPHARKDIWEEGTLTAGAANVNASDYASGLLGKKLGVLWFESASASLLEANAGSGSTVDVYKTVIVGADAIGCLKVPLVRNPACEYLMMDPDGAVAGVISNPGTELGSFKEVGLQAQLGFGFINKASCFVIHSASSMGTNT